jgi:hypothetical protein
VKRQASGIARETSYYRGVFLEREPTCSAGDGGRTSEIFCCGAVLYVCFLSEDGDEFPDTGHIRPHIEGECARCLVTH